MVEADQHEKELDKLLEEAHRISAEFRLAPDEAQEDRANIIPLVKSFISLKKTRKKLLTKPYSQDQCSAISNAMYSLNEALRKRPLKEPTDRFAELYFFLVVVEYQPDFLEDNAIFSEFRQAMIDARQIGLALCDDDAFLAAINEVHKKFLFKQLSKVCLAHVRYGICNANEQAVILSDALRFETLADPDQQEINAKLVEAQQAFTKIECCSTALQPNYNDCLQAASSLSGLYKSGSKRFQVEPGAKYTVVSAFKLLQEMRSRNIPHEAKLQLGLAMLALNEALRSSHKPKPRNRFDDLYEFHECVRFHEELSGDPQIRSDIQACVGEAYQIGLSILASDKGKARLDEKPGKKGEFLSRLGEICHAHAIYECIAADELQVILENGIKFFKMALEISNEKKHLDFNYPRIADCQMRLGRYTEAIESLTNVLNPGDGIKEATAWEARYKFAECHQKLGRREKINSNYPKAHEHFRIAEQWYVKAAHIWEPNLDPCSTQCQNEKNRLLQGQLAWLYLDWDSTDNADKLNNVLIFSNLVAGLLHRKDSHQEAITVLEKLLSYSLSPSAQVRPLIALCQLYIWTGNQQGIQSTTQSLIGAGRQTGVKLDFLSELKDEQQTALSDFEKMKDYVALCNRRLENGDALVILKELKPMVTEVFRRE